jgi:ribose 5-phosphate isomerase RpiB
MTSSTQLSTSSGRAAENSIRYKRRNIKKGENMRIAVINETSAANRNADIRSALEGRGHEIINVGMTQNGALPELQYIHTGLMAAVLVNIQGFLNSVMQYPGVTCGHILNSLDAWLFNRINAGNCISLALNQGYGWAAEINLEMIFDALFSSQPGSGFPEYRQVPQAHSRDVLAQISMATHRTMPEILMALPEEVSRPALAYPGFFELIKPFLDEEINHEYRKAVSSIIDVYS